MKSKKKLDLVLEKIKKTVKYKKKFISLHEPSISKIDIRHVIECLKSTFVSSTGKNVTLFEKKIKKITNSKNVISVVNGTSGLHLSLKILEVKKDDEVLLPSLTFAGTVNSILACSATPHFVDSDYSTFGVNPEKLIVYLKKNTYFKNNKCFNKKTKKKISALVVVHVFGHAAQIVKLKKICSKFKISLVEDAAECIGSYFKKKHLGTFGDIGVISFNGNKTITTGGGGVILTNNTKLAKKARHLSNGSKLKHSWEYVHDEAGFNYKLPALNAALGVSQLINLKKIIKKKRILFLNYKENFKGFKFIHVFKEPKNARSNYWLNTLILNKKDKTLKNKIIRKLNQNNIMTRPVWKPLHTLKHLRNFPRMNLDICEDIYSRVINIPSSPNLIKNYE